MTSLVHRKPDNTALVTYSWVYDNQGRVKTFTNPDGTVTFGYDAASQVTSTSGGTLSESYTYDKSGNRTIAGYTTGADNRLTSDGTYNYTYDSEGNRTRRTKISDSTYIDYTYDYRNRMTDEVYRTSGGVKIKALHYVYDVNDRRIERQLDATGDGVYEYKERYIYDGEDIVLVYDGNNSLLNRYLHGPDFDQPLAEESTGTLKWYLPDEQGSIRDMGDNSGNLYVGSHVIYNSFGVVTSGTPGRYAYTGREWDADAGMYYYRARWYDASVGRFISQDPKGFDAGDANVYRYVGNSSPNAEDPTGMNAVKAFGSGINWAGNIWSNVSSSINDAMSRAGNFVSSIGSAIGNAGSNLSSWFSKTPATVSADESRHDLGQRLVSGGLRTVQYEPDWSLHEMIENGSPEHPTGLKGAQSYLTHWGSQLGQFYEDKEVADAYVADLEAKGMKPCALAQGCINRINENLAIAKEQNDYYLDQTTARSGEIINAQMFKDEQKLMLLRMAPGSGTAEGLLDKRYGAAAGWFALDVGMMLLPGKLPGRIGARGAAEEAGALSRGAQLRAKLGPNFTEYMRYRNQGFSPLKSNYLMKPYEGIGHHSPITQSLGRQLGLGETIMESSLNKVSGEGMSTGRFYELHYAVDPKFNVARFPKSVGGGVWNGVQIGLTKAGPIGKLWYGTSTSLKLTAGGTAAATGGGIYWGLSGSGEK